MEALKGLKMVRRFVWISTILVITPLEYLIVYFGLKATFNLKKPTSIKNFIPHISLNCIDTTTDFHHASHRYQFNITHMVKG